MLVISPYAKKGYIDDAEGEFSTPAAIHRGQLGPVRT
jgi:hypothetical protein